MTEENGIVHEPPPAPKARDGAPPAAAPDGPEQDLSREIGRTVQKQPGDEVRCTKVSRDYYRCNWWAPSPLTGYDNPGMNGPLVTTHRVRQSRFLRVVKTGGRLVIVEGPSAAR